MRQTFSALLVFLVVAIAPAATAAPSDPGGTFLDDDGSVHEGAIEAVATDGITVGCDAAGTVFCPTDPVNRAQMATFLSRALDLPDPTTDHFTDDTGSTHETNINKVADAGISLGCTTDAALYCPDDPVTRAQMATFLSRGLDLTPTPAAARPETIDGETFAAFEITVTCTDVLDCPGDVDVPEGPWYLSEGWNLDNWSITDPVDQAAFQSDGTRVEFIVNGGSPVRTFETFEVDGNDTARKRHNFQMPDDLTGTHQVEVLWYQEDQLRFRVVVSVNLTP